MWAILSDIHGNLEALQAVLADAAANGAVEIICLGDTVGYGPDPLECIRISMDWPVVLQGHFENAVLSNSDMSGWSALAAVRSVFWCRSLLSQLPHTNLRDYLGTRPLTHHIDGISYVHATPHYPLNQYLMPYDIEDQEKISKIAQMFRRLCFNGHTHIPGIFIEERLSMIWRYFSPDECGFEHRLDNRKAICNVGSVGQPHDGNWYASYVLFDGELVRFRRVKYDIHATIRKILRCCRFDGQSNSLFSPGLLADLVEFELVG